MGVTFFASDYPEYFAVFDRALITMFRITSGKNFVFYLCVGGWVGRFPPRKKQIKARWKTDG